MRTAIETLSQTLRLFAEERRRVLSDWRILIGYRRICAERQIPLPPPEKAADMARILINRGDLRPIGGVSKVYAVEIPYARLVPLSEEQVIQEANPWAVFGHLTALVHHQLTDQIPAVVCATNYGSHWQGRIPLGTTPEDWVEVPLPSPRLPPRVGQVSVDWSQTKGKWDFGETIFYSQGSPIYLTDLERTMIDVIRDPEKSGGILTVLRAWRLAADGLDVDRLVRYTDRFDKPVLRQRVGYLLEALGLNHPRLAEWKQTLQRGGSLKLLASAPYSPVYSKEWNLSLNVSPAALAELAEEGGTEHPISRS